MRLARLLRFILFPIPLWAQQPVTRADAVAAALLRGARVALGRADTTAALGAARAARAFPNPTVSGSYSKDTPNYHALGELPLDLPWLRREVGDVSELDVRLAAVNAGQLANVAADDSLAALAALVSLQLQMGLTGGEATIVLVDSLRVPSDSAVRESPVLLPVVAAEASLRSAERSLAFARRSRFAPNIQFGFDTGDPASTTPHQLLPVVGFSLPFPLFNFGRGDVLRAAAERDRALAELDLTRRETGAAVARARRELVAARDRLRRTAGLVESANRVVVMSLQAYSEGAVPLASVLEAQRNAREILARYIDDLATADAAARALKLLTASPDAP